MLVIRSNLVQKDHNLEFTLRLKGLTGFLFRRDLLVRNPECVRWLL